MKYHYFKIIETISKIVEAQRLLSRGIEDVEGDAVEDPKHLPGCSYGVDDCKECGCGLDSLRQAARKLEETIAYAERVAEEVRLKEGFPNNPWPG